MWTHTDDYSVLPNLYIRSMLLDGILKWFEIYPCEGYVLRIPMHDSYQVDENGDYVLDENGNMILERPYRTWGGAMEMPNYNWVTNPKNYHAELYEEGMEVFGKVE